MLNYRKHDHNNHLPTCCLLSMVFSIQCPAKQTAKAQLTNPLNVLFFVQSGPCPIKLVTKYYRLYSESCSVNLGTFVATRLNFDRKKSNSARIKWITKEYVVLIICCDASAHKKANKGGHIYEHLTLWCQLCVQWSRFQKIPPYKFHFLLTCFERKCFMSLVCTFYSALSSRLCSSLHKR